MNPLSLIHWHIELSSICTLKCPRCPRLEVSESLLNRQLSLSFFKNQIGKKTIKDIKRITLCGNDGDPIYCNDFIPIVKWIKEVNPTICIVLITNGSYKKPSWWKELALILNEHDEINWSLDGWDQITNEKYRVNCDWGSIINGIKTFNEFNSTTYNIWALIAFKFNELYFNKVKDLALELEFDAIQTTLSTKFGTKYPIYGDDDPLEPNNSLIPEGHRFERTLDIISSKKRFSETIKESYKEKIKSLSNRRICMIGNKGVFLNSHGEFYPCCWVANRYDHNKEWIDRAQSKFNLNNRTFNEIISDEYWCTDFIKFDNLECETKCANNNSANLEQLIEW